jgi:hypothetical protein
MRTLQTEGQVWRRAELLAENAPPVLELCFVNLAARKALLENIKWRPGGWQLVWRICP